MKHRILNTAKLCLSLMCLFFCDLSATSLDGTSNIVYTTVPQVFHNGEFAKGFVALEKGFTVPAMSGARLNLVVPVSCGMDLRTTGSIILENDLRLDSGFTLSSSGTICGNGYSLILNDDLIIPAQSTLKITSSLKINGNDHTIFFDGYSQILVDRHATLTLKNVILKNTFNNSEKPVIGTGGTDSMVAFDNVKFALNDDFFFNQGSFFVHNNVDYNGNTSFYYRSPQTSFIAPQSTFYFDNQSRFFYNPQDTSDNLIVMQDQSSTLFFDGSTLRSTPTGLILNDGNLYFNDLVNLDAGVSLTVSTYLLSLIEYAPTGIGGVRTTSWHPSGKYVALGGEWAEAGAGGFANTDCVRLYEFDISTPPYFFPAISIPTGFDVAWRGDGQYLAVLETDYSFTYSLSIYKFDLSPMELTPITSAQVWNLPSNFKDLIDWHPSGEYISLVNINSDSNPQVNVYYFDYIHKSMDLFATTSNNDLSDSIRCAKWNFSGEYLATAIQGKLKVFYFDQFNLDPNARLQEFASVDSNYSVNNVDWSTDGRYIASCGSDTNNQTKVYEFNPSGSPRLNFVTEKQLSPTAIAYTLKWAPNKYILSSGGSAGLFEGYYVFATYEFDPTKPSTYMKMDQISKGNAHRNSYGYLSLNWSPDGTILSTALPEFTPFYKFVAPNQQLVATENFQTEAIQHGIKSVSWHPNKKHVAISGYGAGPVGTINNNDEIRVYKFDDMANSLSPITSKSYGNYSVNCMDLRREAIYPYYQHVATGNSSTDLTANFVSKAKWQINSDTARTFSDHYAGPEFGGVINSVGWVSSSYIAAAGVNINNSIKVYQDTGSALTFNAESPTYGGTINSIAVENGTALGDGYITAGGSNAGNTLRLYRFIPSVSFNQVAESSTGYGGTINSIDTDLDWDDNILVAVGGSNSGNTIQIYKYNNFSGGTLDKIDESGDCGGQINCIKYNGFLVAIGDWGGSIKVFSSSSGIPLIAESETYPNPLKALYSDGYNIYTIEANTNIVRLHIFDSPYTSLTLIFQSEASSIDINAITPGPMLGYSNNLIKAYADFGDLGLVLLGGIQSVPISANSSIWSPDGNFLAIGGQYASAGSEFANNDELRIYHFYKNELYPVTSQSTGSGINALCWHPSEKYLAVATDSNVSIYSFDGSTLSFVTNYVLNCDCLDWSPDGQFLAVTENGTGTLRVLSFLNESSLSLLCSGGGNTTVNWSSDGRYIATRNGNLSIYNFTGSSLVLVDNSQSIFGGTNKIKFAEDAHSLASVANPAYDVYGNTLPSGSQLFYFNDSQSSTASSKDSILSEEGLDWRVDGNYIGVGNVETPLGAPDLLIYKVNYLADYLNQSKGLDLNKNLNVNVLGGANVNINGIVNFNKN